MTLIAEDLMLLLLDDEKGTTPALWVDVKTPLAAAALAELGILGAVELEPGTFWRGATLRATGQRVADPVLSRALDVVAEKPRTPSALAERIGTGLRDTLADRLVTAGLLRRQDDRVLGLFPRTTWPSVDTSREHEVLQRLRATLVDGAEPDERTTVLAGILGALDRVPAVLRLQGAEARGATKRAKALAKGEWASKAVSDAVVATMTAVMVPVVAVAATTAD